MAAKMATVVGLLLLTLYHTYFHMISLYYFFLITSNLPERVRKWIGPLQIVKTPFKLCRNECSYFLT